MECHETSDATGKFKVFPASFKQAKCNVELVLFQVYLSTLVKVKLYSLIRFVLIWPRVQLSDPNARISHDQPNSD